MTAATFGESTTLAQANPGQTVNWHLYQVRFEAGQYTISAMATEGQRVSGTHPLPYVAMQILDGELSRVLAKHEQEKRRNGNA